MGLAGIVFIVLGPVCLIASFLAKSRVRLIALNLLGIVLISVVVSMLSCIPGLYAQEHRGVENRYHRQIVMHIDTLLRAGQTEQVTAFIDTYVAKTEGSDFLRDDLADIVSGISEDGTTKP
jgi:cell division protein FtsW (lipid II flippase)